MTLGSPIRKLRSGNCGGQFLRQLGGILLFLMGPPEVSDKPQTINELEWTIQYKIAKVGQDKLEGVF